MKVFVVLVVCLSVVAEGLITPDELILKEWETYKLTFSKNYTDPFEDKFRLNVFMESKNFIGEHNKAFAEGTQTFSVGINQFSDFLNIESSAFLNGYRNLNESTILRSSYLRAGHVRLPRHIDWRDHGLVTHVKRQEPCASCWAFSAIGALEGQWKKKTGNLISLSEQNVLDCSPQDCTGGDMITAFQYIRDNPGVNSEDTYPYETKKLNCRFDKRKTKAFVTGVIDLFPGNELLLQEAVATIGPISVSVYAELESFKAYKKGIYFDEKCSNTKLTHGVLVVGYGEDEDCGPYWIIKNSWGETWGEKGYMKLARNADNHCGIANEPSFPLV